MNKKSYYLTQAAAIAALYVVLTLIANTFGLANYAIQVRFSEALTILPFFTSASIPGLFVGCLLSNLITGCAVADTICGSLATLVAAIVTYVVSDRLKHSKGAEYLAPIPPIVANTIVVPLVLYYAYGLNEVPALFGSLHPILYFALTVCVGEIISCGVLGVALLKALKPKKDFLFRG